MKQLSFLRESDSSDLESEEDNMAQNRTLKELANPKLAQQPIYITFPDLNSNTTFELKFSLIHILPSFYSHAGKDPYKHIKKFHMICTSMKPTGVIDIKLWAFLFSLKDVAKDWFHYRPSGSIITWAGLERLFL